MQVSSIIAFLFLTSISGVALDSAPTPNADSRNAALFSQIEKAEQESWFTEADSLYKVLDRPGALNAPRFLRWARIKEVMGDYTAMAGLYCRAAGSEPGMLDIAFHHLSQSLESAPADSIVHALGVFQKCAFEARGVDTLRLVLWFADFYSRRGMDAEELRVLEAAVASGVPLASRLFDFAREQFARGQFENAILPARIAWERAPDPPGKKAVSLLICRAFQSLHKNDSALVWLSRTDISSNNTRIEAVSIYQNGGKLAEALKNIGLLAPSFIRDTLEIRQRLFSNDTKGAVLLVEKLAQSRPWLDKPVETLRWKMRTLLFNGQTDALSSVFDSQSVRASGNDAREYVTWRLMFQQLSGDPGALSGWCRLEYGIFVGKRPSVAEIVGKQVAGESSTHLLLRLVKDLLAKGEQDAALTIFRDKSAFSDAPEYRYLYAETLGEIGERARAQELLAGIIEDSPSDIYSEKARVLLRKIQNR